MRTPSEAAGFDGGGRNAGISRLEKGRNHSPIRPPERNAALPNEAKFGLLHFRTIR